MNLSASINTSLFCDVNYTLYLNYSSLDFKDKLISILEKISSSNDNGKNFLNHVFTKIQKKNLFIEESASSSFALGLAGYVLKFNCNESERHLSEDKEGQWHMNVAWPAKILIHELIHAINYADLTPKMRQLMKDEHSVQWTDELERLAIQGSFMDKYTDHRLTSKELKRVSHMGCNIAFDKPKFYIPLVYGADGGADGETVESGYITDEKSIVEHISMAYLSFPFKFANVVKKDYPFIELFVQHKIKALKSLLLDFDDEKLKEFLTWIQAKAQESRYSGGGSDTYLTKQIQALVKAAEDLVAEFSSPIWKVWKQFKQQMPFS